MIALYVPVRTHFARTDVIEITFVGKIGDVTVFGRRSRPIVIFNLPAYAFRRFVAPYIGGGDGEGKRSLLVSDGETVVHLVVFDFGFRLLAAFFEREFFNGSFHFRRVFYFHGGKRGILVFADKQIGGDFRKAYFGFIGIDNRERIGQFKLFAVKIRQRIRARREFEIRIRTFRRFAILTGDFVYDFVRNHVAFFIRNRCRRKRYFFGVRNLRSVRELFFEFYREFFGFIPRAGRIAGIGTRNRKQHTQRRRYRK